MNNEKISSELIESITESQDFLDELFSWLRYHTEIDEGEYQVGIDEVSKLLYYMNVFDPTKNTDSSTRIILKGEDGDILGKAEPDNNSVKNHDQVPFNIITLEDIKGNSIGRCESITVNPANNKEVSNLTLSGVTLTVGYSIQDILWISITNMNAVNKFHINNSIVEGDTIKCEAEAIPYNLN